MAMLIYATHPEVVIDADVPVPQWGLSTTGAFRAARFAASEALTNVGRVISSDETKALDLAHLIATELELDIEVRPDTGETDRSVPGFAPPDEFELQANAWFAHPDESPYGWETATAAQQRIVSALHDLVDHGSVAEGLAEHTDVVVVGHGGVGTLLYCHLAGFQISRIHDQPHPGHYFVVDLATMGPLHGWRRFEDQ
jgi:broad specificity phosphatase PhoE